MSDRSVISNQLNVALGPPTITVRNSTSITKGTVVIMTSRAPPPDVRMGSPCYRTACYDERAEPPAVRRRSSHLLRWREIPADRPHRRLWLPFDFDLDRPPTSVALNVRRGEPEHVTPAQIVDDLSVFGR